MPSELLDFEGNREAKIVADRASFKIDAQFIRRMLGRACEQVVDLGFSQLNWQHTVFETVAEEDVSERWCEDRSQAVIFQCPNRVLATRSAAEVTASDQDRGPFGGGLIEFKFWIVGTVVFETPIEEQVLAKTRAFDAFEELFGNDLVSVDVSSIEAANDTAFFYVGFHGGF